VVKVEVSLSLVAAPEVEVVEVESAVWRGRRKRRQAVVVREEVVVEIEQLY
jgi:hypothetical protein